MTIEKSILGNGVLYDSDIFTLHHWHALFTSLSMHLCSSKKWKHAQTHTNTLLNGCARARLCCSFAPILLTLNVFAFFARSLLFPCSYLVHSHIQSIQQIIISCVFISIFLFAIKMCTLFLVSFFSAFSFDYFYFVVCCRGLLLLFQRYFCFKQKKNFFSAIFVFYFKSWRFGVLYYILFEKIER